MKRKRVFAAFLSLVLAGQMAFSAIPAYAAGSDEGVRGTEEARSGEIDPDADNNDNGGGREDHPCRRGQRQPAEV